MRLTSAKNRKIFYLMIIVIFSIVILVPLSLEGFFLSRGYLEPWNKNYSDNFSDPRIKILSNSILAPNGHNLQNWKFILSKEDISSFDVYIDSSRLAGEVDPLLTQTIISHGALFSYMDESAKFFGYKLNIILFPDGEIYKQADKDELDTRRVANVLIEKTNSSQSDLYKNIFKPDTSRLGFKKEEISEYVLRNFNDLNDSDAINISYIGPNSYKYEEIKNYILESVKIETGIDRIMNESKDLFRINEKEKNQYRYGFSFEGSSLNPVKKHFLQSFLTIFPKLNNKENVIKEYKKQTEIAINNNSGFLLIKTNSNTLKNEFDAGYLYGKIVLKAHEYNLSLQPFSAPIEEYEEMQDLNKKFHSEFANKDEKILMVFRIGEPKGNTQKSMRIGINDLIK